VSDSIVRPATDAIIAQAIAEVERLGLAKDQQTAYRDRNAVLI